MSYGYAPMPLPPPQYARTSWFSRNWKWFVPTIIAGPILVIVLMISGLFTLGMAVIKSSEPYQHAVGAAAGDAQVTSQLGSPVTPGWYAGGRFNVSGSSGDVDLFIPLNGKLRHGTLYVVGRESGGVWRYQRLEVAIDGEADRINLLQSRQKLPSPKEDK